MLSTGGGGYSWVWIDGPGNLRDECILGVTIAGMWDRDTPSANEHVALFLDMLRVMVGVERAYEPSPAEVSPVLLPTDRARLFLRDANQRWDLGPRAADDLRDTLSHEPATWHSHGTDASWTLSPFLRGYTNIDAADEYVARVIEVNHPAPPASEPTHASSLALPEAIDYLNLVWQAHTGERLVSIGRAEAAVKLALDCSTADEFDARVSALCSVLSAVNVPNSEESKLVTLRDYLEETLGDGSARAAAAVDDLRAVFDLRVWRQHPGTDERGARGMARLGLPLPVFDWGAAWGQVQARSVAALSTLREEVEVLS